MTTVWPVLLPVEHAWRAHRQEVHWNVRKSELFKSQTDRDNVTFDVRLIIGLSDVTSAALKRHSNGQIFERFKIPIGCQGLDVDKLKTSNGF